jgi:hypothetical protein
MPRLGSYTYWSSRNVATLEVSIIKRQPFVTDRLQAFDDVNELDWRSTWKPEVEHKPKTIEQVKEKDGTSTLRNETYAGTFIPSLVTIDTGC